MKINKKVASSETQKWSISKRHFPSDFIKSFTPHWAWILVYTIMHFYGFKREVHIFKTHFENFFNLFGTAVSFIYAPVIINLIELGEHSYFIFWTMSHNNFILLLTKIFSLLVELWLSKEKMVFCKCPFSLVAIKHKFHNIF